MDKRPDRLDRIVSSAVRLCAYISGIALFWLMGLTVVAVIMRYVFNAPILGGQDLSEVSLIVVVFPALAYCGWTGGHVALDVVASRLKPRTLLWSDRVVHTVSGLLFSYIAWQTWRRGLDAYRYGEASNLIEIPRSPFFFIIAIGAGLYALVLFVQALRASRPRPGAKHP